MKVFFVLLIVVSLVGCSSNKTTEKTKKTKTLKGNYQVYFDKTSCHNNGRHRSMSHKQRDRKRK